MTASLTISQEFQIPNELAYINQLQQHIAPEKLSAKGELDWGRLICTWYEKRENGNIQAHTYAASIDGKEGGIYLDCRPGKIFAKCLAHLFIRPLHTIIKTIYQLSLYPVFKEIAKSYPSEKSNQEKIINVVKTVADIILTPLYGLILTITTVAVLIAGIISPTNLYEGRKLLGKIEQAANGGHIHTFWTLANCFQPYPLDILGYYGKKDCSHDTEYEGQDLVERQLTNFARAHIRKKRFLFDPFSCSKLKPTVPYQSSILI